MTWPKSEYRNIQPLVNKTLALYRDWGKRCTFNVEKDGAEFKGLVESEETGRESSPTKDFELESQNLGRKTSAMMVETSTPVSFVKLEWFYVKIGLEGPASSMHALT